MQYRANKIAQEIKQEVSRIIARELPHHQLGFITITDVRVTSDLREARIFISVFGSPAERTETLDTLNSEKPFIRHLIGRRIKMRHTPEISFVYDESIEGGAQMMRLIDEIKKELPEE